MIKGEPASKANSRRLVQLGNRLASIKSKKALSYADGFRLQCKKLPELLKGDVQVEMRIWYASRRPDLDESLILDLLQGYAYENDRQVKRKVIEWAGVDKANPRTWIRVTRLGVGADL